MRAMGMINWAWRGDIHQIALLFQNTLPVFDSVTGRLYTKYYRPQADLDLQVPTAVIQPASLTVFDGEGFLHQHAVIYGRWRRNGLSGSATLKAGLKELLQSHARRDDPAICLMDPVRINRTEHASYFTLYRVTADRLSGFSQKEVDRILRICRARTTELLDCLLENDNQAAAVSHETHKAAVV